MVLEQLVIYMHKKRERERIYTQHLSPSQKFTDLNVKHKTIKF